MVTSAPVPPRARVMIAMSPTLSRRIPGLPGRPTVVSPDSAGVAGQRGRAARYLPRPRASQRCRLRRSPGGPAPARGRPEQRGEVQVEAGPGEVRLAAYADAGTRPFGCRA